MTLGRASEWLASPQSPFNQSSKPVSPKSGPDWFILQQARVVTARVMLCPQLPFSCCEVPKAPCHRCQKRKQSAPPSAPTPTEKPSANGEEQMSLSSRQRVCPHTQQRVAATGLQSSVPDSVHVQGYRNRQGLALSHCSDHCRVCTVTLRQSPQCVVGHDAWISSDFLGDYFVEGQSCDLALLALTLAPLTKGLAP